MMQTNRKSTLSRFFRPMALLRLCLGVLILVAVIWRVGLSGTWAVLKEANVLYLLGAVDLFFLMYLVKSLRWRTLLAQQDMHLSVWRALSLYVSTSLFGYFTPGRIGEAVRVLPPARDQKRYAESLACTAVDKSFDISLLAILLCLASLSSLLSRKEATALFAAGIVIACVLTCGLVLLAISARKGVVIPGIMLRLMPVSWREAVEKQPNRFVTAGIQCLANTWRTGVGCTALFWILHVGCHYLIFLALGGRMDPWYFVLCLTLSSLIEFIPVTICGLGTREYLLVYLFGRVGIETGTALAFALVNVFFIYAVTSIFTLALWAAFDEKGGGAGDRGRSSTTPEPTPDPSREGNLLEDRD